VRYGIQACLAFAVPHVGWEWWNQWGNGRRHRRKLSAWAAINADAYAPMEQIGELHGTDAPWQHIHPRPPAALLAQLPLVVAPNEWLLTVVAVITAGSIAATMWASYRLVGGSVRLWQLGAVLLAAVFHLGRLWPRRADACCDLIGSVGLSPEPPVFRRVIC